MNWNDIKNGLNSKPARIIYAVIVIAAIMTAVGFGIYYLYGLLTKGACQPGQFYNKEDGVCYPGECANDCDDDKAERNWNKENKTCDCECIDGYNNNNFDKKCNPECAKGQSCDSGQTCAIVSDSCGNSKQCIDTSASNYQKCGNFYCDKNSGVKCDDEKQVCVVNGTKTCSKTERQACIVGEKGKGCPDGDGCTLGGDVSPFFNKFREEGSKLGYCNKGPNCCADNKITLKLLEGGEFCPYCCTDDTNPCIADDYTPSGCCKNTPCNDGRCPVDGKTRCTEDGICPINEVYRDKDDDKLHCCTDETVYKTLDGKVTCPKPGTKVSTITDDKYAPKCSTDDNCNSIPNSQCISILDKTGNFDDSRCRAVCGEEYVLTSDNKCVKGDNICDWNIETGTANFTPEARDIKDGKKTIINICKTDDNKKLWWKPNTEGEQLDNYKLNAVIQAKNDNCKKYKVPELEDSCRKFLSGELASTTETDLTVKTAKDTRGNPTCTFNIDCCKLPGTLPVPAPPSNKESFRNWMSIENFGNFEDKTDEETPCVKDSKLTDNKWWVNQTLDPIYISAQWDGQKYDTTKGGEYIPFDHKKYLISDRSFAFLNTGEYCDSISLDGKNCSDGKTDNICPMTKYPFTSNQYENNVKCNFPRKWSCGDSTIFGWKNCCDSAGFLTQQDDSTEVQPQCTYFTFKTDVIKTHLSISSIKYVPSSNKPYIYVGPSTFKNPNYVLNLDIRILNNNTDKITLLKNSLCIFREAHNSSHLYLSLKINSNKSYRFDLTDNPDLTIFYNINNLKRSGDYNINASQGFSYPGGFKNYFTITTGQEKPLFMNFETKYNETYPNYLKNELITLNSNATDTKYNSVFPACFTNSSGHERIIIVAVHIEYNTATDYKDPNTWKTTDDTINVLCKKTNGDSLVFRTFDLNAGSLQSQLRKKAHFMPLELNGVTLPHILNIQNDDSADNIIYKAVNPKGNIKNYVKPQQILKQLKK